MRDVFDAKMCRERDLEWGEQETSEAGAKEAYATLVHDQGSRVNCFNLTFFTIQFTPSQPPPLPPFNNYVLEQAFLANIYDQSSKKSDRDPRGAFRNPTDFTGAADGIVSPFNSFGKQQFQSTQCRTCFERNGSRIGPANTSAIEGTTRRLGGGKAGTAGLSPLGTSSSPTSIGSVRSPWSPSANTGTPGATRQSQHEVLNAAAAGRSSAY